LYKQWGRGLVTPHDVILAHRDTVDQDPVVHIAPASGDVAVQFQDGAVDDCRLNKFSPSSFGIFAEQVTGEYDNTEVSIEDDDVIEDDDIDRRNSSVSNGDSGVVLDRNLNNFERSRSTAQATKNPTKNEIAVELSSGPESPEEGLPIADTKEPFLYGGHERETFPDDGNRNMSGSFISLIAPAAAGKEGSFLHRIPETLVNPDLNTKSGNEQLDSITKSAIVAGPTNALLNDQKHPAQQHLKYTHPLRYTHDVLVQGSPSFKDEKKMLTTSDGGNFITCFIQDDAKRRRESNPIPTNV